MQFQTKEQREMEVAAEDEVHTEALPITLTEVYMRF